MPASKVYLWRYAQANPNTRSAKSDAESTHIFKFPKYLYNYYKSATIHTHKTKIPTKYLLFILIPIGLFAWSAYSFYHSPFSPHKSAQQEKPKASTTSETTAHNPSNQQIQQPIPQQTFAIQAPAYDPLTRVAFVVSTDNNCIAKNQYGEVLNMPVYKCYLYAESPSMLSMPRERDDTPDRRDSQTEPAKPSAPLQQVVRPQTVDYQTAAGVDVAQSTVTQQTNI
jgi:zona occludens toxin